MQFEKIRTINKRKIIVGGVIGLGVISAMSVLPSLAKYRTTESFNIVNGTINYRVPDMNLVAMYTVDEENNEESISTIPTDDGNYTYTLNTSKSACTVDGEQISSSIELENGSLTFKGITEKGTKCNVYFDKVKAPENFAEQTLANLGITNPKEATENMFASVATTDEGVFSVADPMYGTSAYSYYYRGAVNNNYVKFARFCWRIIRINGDGSIRMIYDGTTCHANGTSTTESVAVASQAYNSTASASYYVGYTYTNSKQRPTDNATATASNLKTQTESWYKTNIIDKGYNDKVADGYFCNDRNTASGYTWASAPSSTFYYAARERLESAKTPSLECDTSDIYTLKAGAITADEVSFAGGVLETSNNLYYLYNGQYYWTMFPTRWYYSTSYHGTDVFFVSSDGRYNSAYVTDKGSGVRPVINLKADTVFSSGDGTINTPFTVQ